MSPIIYLVVSLLLAGFSFFVLYTDKWPILRGPAWVLFYLSMAVIVTLWLQFFFPGTFYNGELSDLSWKLALGGKMCLVCFVILAFFLWVYLIHRQDEMSLSLIAKDISRFFITILVMAIILISFVSFAARYSELIKY